MGLQTDVQALTDEVARQTTITQSVLTLIQGLLTQIQTGIDAADLAAIQSAVTAFRANDDALAAAVPVSTPAAPTPAAGS